MRKLLFLVVLATTTADRLVYAYQPLGQLATFGNSNGISSDNFGRGVEKTNTKTLGVADAFGSGLGGFDGSNNINTNRINNINNKYDNVEHNSITTNGGSSGNANGANGFRSSYNNNRHDGTNRSIVTDVHKKIYSYKALDDEEENNFNEPVGARALGAIRKHLRIIFIRAPQNQAFTNEALKLAKQASEDRTAIYVLTKHTDAAELANRLQTIKSGSRSKKPVVHFVKYRTPEDAIQEQQAIQAQYDALDGPMFSMNAGVAPVLNFVGSDGVSVDVGGNSAAYLPSTALLKT